MAEDVACTNQKCGHSFTASTTVGMASLTCPRCGQIVPLRKRVVNREAARQTPPANAEQVSPMNAPAKKVATRKPYKPRRGWGKVVVVILVCLGGLAGVYKFVQFQLALPKQDGVVAGEILKFSQLNYRFVKPEKDWSEVQGEPKASLRADLVLQRPAPAGWLAILTKKDRERTPSDDEARREVVQRLGNYFRRENFEWDQGTDAELAGKRAQRIVFNGEAEVKNVAGECLILCHQGIAYFLVTWAPAGADHHQDLAEMSSRFGILKDVPGWNEKKPAARLYRGRVGYSLEDVDSNWAKWTPAADYDPNALLALTGSEKGLEKDRNSFKPPIAATVLILALKPVQKTPQDAMELAKKHFHETQKKDYPDSAMEEVPDRLEKEPDRVGSAKGLKSSWHVKSGEKRRRFVMLAVVNHEDQVLVVQCETAWESRDVWEGRFKKLLGTFRLTKSQGPGGEDPDGDTPDS
jgi:hypothetical protein